MRKDHGDIEGGLNDKTIAVLGAGKMGTLFVDALLNKAGVAASKLRVTVKHSDHARQLNERMGVSVTLDNAAAATGADLLLLCVKPQQVPELLAEIDGAISNNTLLISIATGVSIASIESCLRTPIAVIRAMPNTACRIGKGMTAFCHGARLNAEMLAIANRLFETLGRTAEVDEPLLNAVTGLSASGPAFVYVILEAMAEGGVRAGLTRQLATTLAAQAMLGAASMALQTNQHPALLKSEVTTPAGCTIEGLLELEDGGIRATLIRAVTAAAEKAARIAPPSLSNSSYSKTVAEPPFYGTAEVPL